MSPTQCELCHSGSSNILVQKRRWRIIDAGESMFPGFTRVIWNDHAREMTDLREDERNTLMQVVFRVEQVMRDILEPDKINLASLGNMVAHVHWHIIPRWQDDIAFPAPVWNAPSPDAQKSALAGARAACVHGRLRDYHQALSNAFDHEP